MKIVLLKLAGNLKKALFPEQCQQIKKDTKYAVIVFEGLAEFLAEEIDQILSKKIVISPLPFLLPFPTPIPPSHKKNIDQWTVMYVSSHNFIQITKLSKSFSLAFTMIIYTTTFFSVSQ